MPMWGQLTELIADSSFPFSKSDIKLKLSENIAKLPICVELLVMSVRKNLYQF